MVTAGSLIGAKPENEAISCVGEYLPVAGYIFWADPVFPADVQPSRRAFGPVPFNTTPSIRRRKVAAVSGRMACFGSTGASGPVIGMVSEPRLTSATTCGLWSVPPLAM